MEISDVGRAERSAVIEDVNRGMRQRGACGWAGIEADRAALLIFDTDGASRRRGRETDLTKQNNRAGNRIMGEKVDRWVSEGRRQQRPRATADGHRDKRTDPSCLQARAAALTKPASRSSSNLNHKHHAKPTSDAVLPFA